MSFLTVDRFLFCLELEIGGLVLGWLATIGFGLSYCFLAAVAMLGWFLGGAIQPSEDMLHQLVISWFNNILENFLKF